MWWACMAWHWLMDHGALPKNRAQEYYSSYVAGIFRSVRYGVAEAHGRAEMMEFNYLVGAEGGESRRAASMRWISRGCRRRSRR